MVHMANFPANDGSPANDGLAIVNNNRLISQWLAMVNGWYFMFLDH